MPQELHVVKCCSCETFQVDIVKKKPKWECKMCGEKQSLQKARTLCVKINECIASFQVYFKGSGKDCRLQVQDLSGKQSKEMGRPTLKLQSALDSAVAGENHQNEIPHDDRRGKGSRWSEFLENTDEECVSAALERPVKKQCLSNSKDEVSTLRISDLPLLKTRKRWADCMASLTKHQPKAEDEVKEISSLKVVPPARETQQKQSPCSNVNLEDGRDVVNKTSKWSEFITHEDEADGISESSSPNSQAASTSKTFNSNFSDFSSALTLES